MAASLPGRWFFYGLETVFLLTDYTTATLVGNEIWIIGSLGYKHHRDARPTQIRMLKIQTWIMRIQRKQGVRP